MKPQLDWTNLGFAYHETRGHVAHHWKDGAWDSGYFQKDPYLSVHIAATALHYGQSAFEGLKAFRSKDGKVGIFRPQENARRMQTASQRIVMPEIPEKMFVESVSWAVRENIDYLPPYGSGGSLYIRPLLFGSGSEIGLGPAKEYTFLVLVTPVGAYFQEGIQAFDARVVEDYDRAAPLGVGYVKLAGNYAASLLPGKLSKEAGFPLALYLDAKERRYIDEFGTSNFIGIDKKGVYVTPKSPSILPSITNRSLMTLAEDSGLRVEQRRVAFEELSDFREIGACGTAVVIAPVKKIVRGDREIVIQDHSGFGPQLKKLYDRFRGIQFGEIKDQHGWLHQP